MEALSFFTHPLTLTKLDIPFVALILSLLWGLLPLKRPLLWHFLERISALFYRKMNKQERSEKARRVRGLIFPMIIILASFFIPRSVIHNLYAGGYGDYVSYISAFVLSLCLATSGVWSFLWAGSQIPLNTKTKKKDTGNLATKIAPFTQDDISDKDAHHLSRTMIVYAARSIDRHLIGPLLYFWLFGLIGAVVFVTISALKFSSSYRNDHSRAYAWLINMLDNIANFFPARIAAFLIFLACVFTKNVSAKRSVSTTFYQAPSMNSLNAGWPIAAIAGALNLALAGPNKQEQKSSDQPWIGPKESTAKATEKDIKRVLALHINSVFIIVFLFAAIYWAQDIQTAYLELLGTINR